MRYWLAAALVVAAAAGGVVGWRHASAPASGRTVQVAVYGAQAVTVPQQPGIDYDTGHMVPPTRQSSTVRQSPTDASVVLTTPAGRTRQTDQTLPWRRTVTLRPGQEVLVSVSSATATSLECMITLDGDRLAVQDATHAATCRAQL